MIIRDSEKNTLRISGEISFDGMEYRHNFREKMLYNNNIEGLLKFRTFVIDHEKIYEYDTEGLCTMETRFGRENAHPHIEDFLKKLTEIIIRGEGYMLEEADYILDPRYIFVNENGDPSVAYYPGYGHSFQEQITQLAEYLMNRMDYHDRESVITVYTVYMKSKEEGFTVRKLISFLEEDRPNTGNERKEEVIFDKSGYGFYEEPVENVTIRETERKPEKAINKKINTKNPADNIGLISGAVFMVIVLAATFGLGLVKGKNNTIDPIKCLCVFLVGGGGGYYIYRKLSLNGKRKKSEKKPDSGFEVQSLADDEATELLFDPDAALSHKEIFTLVSDEYPSIKIENFPFYIGKDSDHMDFCLKAPGISRYHLKVDKSGDRLYVSDLNSTNGSFVNGEKIEPDRPVNVHEGDRITLGKCNYRLISTG